MSRPDVDWDGPLDDTFGPAGSESQRWAWILLLVDAAEQAGLTPIDIGRLHRLAFFANCLSPVYDLPEEEGKVMKHVRGPHYPELQWDLDRLYVMGKVEMQDFTPFEDPNGWWFSAHYTLAESALEVIPWIRRSPRLARVHDFQVELAFAFADLSPEVQVASTDRDATYADPLVAVGDVIDFAEWSERNFSEQTATAVAAYVPPGFPLGARDRLHLYFRYLSRLGEGGSGARRVAQ